MKDIRRSREMLLDSLLSETTYVVFRFLNCNSIHEHCRKHNKNKKCTYYYMRILLRKKRPGFRGTIALDKLSSGNDERLIFH